MDFENDPDIAFSDGFDAALEWYRENPREFAAFALHPDKWVLDWDGLTNIRTGKPHPASRKI